MTAEYARTIIENGPDTRPIPTLDPTIACMFEAGTVMLTPHTPWAELPDLDAAADAAMEDAALIIDPQFLEWQAAAYVDPSLPEEEQPYITKIFSHERETAALLRGVLHYPVPPALKTIMTTYAMVHDSGGKTSPQLLPEYLSDEKWTPEKVDRLSLAHCVHGEERIMPLAMHRDAHFAIQSIAKLTGIHHWRNLQAIPDPRLRWMVGVFQEADKAQAILLDKRKYMGDGKTREGISLQDIDSLEEKIVKPFHAPSYYGIEPGRVFNMALGFREQRLAALAINS